MEQRKKIADSIVYIVLTVLAVAFLVPIFLVIMNSLKNKLYISTTPFVLPNGDSFVGLKNYVDGLTKIHFFDSVGYSLFITVFSVLAMVIFCSMTAWFITRVKSKITSGIYYMFVASMVVPFQMVMYTMTKTADALHLNNYVGIIVVYLGFGAGMSVFMFSGFVKGIPMELEEAALIDGCNPLTMYIKVVFPILKPISITVAILNAMWVWNDYLLPTLVLDIKKYKTIPMLIQYFRGSYGRVEMGPMMASIMLTVIPIIIVYLAGQKYIIKGVAAGAVKG